jgi:hypothetical protein
VSNYFNEQAFLVKVFDQQLTCNRDDGTRYALLQTYAQYHAQGYVRLMAAFKLPW